MVEPFNERGLWADVTHACRTNVGREFYFRVFLCAKMTQCYLCKDIKRVVVTPTKRKENADYAPLRDVLRFLRQT